MGGELASGAAVESHLCDQLILPASLAAGTSRLLAAELSLHAQTAIHIAELMVPGVKVRREQRGALTLIEIDGIGHEPVGAEGGADTPSIAPAAAAPSSGAQVVQLAAGMLSEQSQEFLRDLQKDLADLSDGTGCQ